MNSVLERSIAALEAERDRLTDAIHYLRQCQTAITKQASVKGRQGRKSMSPDERKQVSARMKTYWERRRNAARAAGVTWK
jgi:hypothetical protein